MLVPLALACGDDSNDMRGGAPAAQSCVPGPVAVCPCADGSQGTRICDVSGLAFGTCTCGQTQSGGASGEERPAWRGHPDRAASAGTTGMAGMGTAGHRGPRRSRHGCHDAEWRGRWTGRRAPRPAGRSARADIAIAEIAIYQAVKISLSAAGEAVIARNAPVIVGKEALLRVFVETLPASARASSRSS